MQQKILLRVALTALHSVVSNRLVSHNKPIISMDSSNGR